MKRFLVACLLLLTVACSEDKPIVEFDFTDNLAIQYNTKTDIGVKVLSKDVSSIEIYLDDELQQTFDNPQEFVKLTLNAKEIGLGAKTIKIIAFQKNGEKYTESRLLRILSDLVPEKWFYEVEANYPHDISSFTQGLEFHKGQLFESTGQNGSSRISKIDIPTGKIIAQKGISDEHFGEGITILGDTLYQLTWQTGTCFIYNPSDLSIYSKEFKFSGEGWGICNNGKSLIVSDGTERLYFRDPKTFEIQKVIEVYTNEAPVSRLNELEYVDGIIYANIWMSNIIVAIDEETGRVIGTIDGASLAKTGRGKIGEAFNGIAYNREQDAFYLTGKQWEKLFRIKLIKNKPIA